MTQDRTGRLFWPFSSTIDIESLLSEYVRVFRNIQQEHSDIGLCHSLLGTDQTGKKHFGEEMCLRSCLGAGLAMRHRTVPPEGS